MTIYYEEKPAEVTGDFPAITIRYRPQDKLAAERIGRLLEEDDSITEKLRRHNQTQDMWYTGRYTTI